ncbi:MAG: flavodoxin family protein [Bacteroides sp.]|nr:flavodoxin family protein [Bacteroides sp.]
MKKILAFNGSPRPSGNTAHLLKAFLSGAEDNGALPELYHPHKLNLKECTGCLRCNVLKRCSLGDDDWEDISSKIVEADVLVFGSPIYFHHVPSSMKKLLDRFRSLVHVRITETGLIHTPYHEWNKEIVLILSLGASQIDDAQPVIDLFKYISSIMGSGNKLHVITGTRLAMVKQVKLEEDELKALYGKMGLAESLASEDFKKNNNLLLQCHELGMKLS